MGSTKRQGCGSSAPSSNFPAFSASANYRHCSHKLQLHLDRHHSCGRSTGALLELRIVTPQTPSGEFASTRSTEMSLSICYSMRCFATSVVGICLRNT